MKQHRYVYKSRKVRAVFYVIDAVGKFVFTLVCFIRPQRKSLQDVRKILVCKLDHIGDVLLATPTVEAIRKMFPQAHVTMMVREASNQVLKDNPDIDEVRIYDAAWLTRKARTPNWKSFVRLIRSLRKERYDVFFDLRGDVFVIVMAFLSRIPLRVGFGSMGLGFLLTHEVEVRHAMPPLGRHQVEILFEAVKRLGCQQPVTAPKLFVSSDEREKANALMPHHHSLIIGFHIGAGDPTRLWALDRYAQVMNLVKEKYNSAVVLVGGKEDNVLIEQMKPLLACEPLNLTGLSITETAAIIEKCDLFIGNNSSQIHLAAAIGTPVIVLHTTSLDSRRWRAYGDNVRVIEKEVFCSYCEKRTCDDMRCMSLITVAEVMEHIDQMVKVRVQLS